MGKRRERLIPPKKQSGDDRRAANVSLGSTRSKKGYRQSIRTTEQVWEVKHSRSVIPFQILRHGGCGLSDDNDSLFHTLINPCQRGVVRGGKAN